MESSNEIVIIFSPYNLIFKPNKIWQKKKLLECNESDIIVGKRILYYYFV